MRSNGLHLALATLLVPAAAFAQTAEPAALNAGQVDAVAADAGARPATVSEQAVSEPAAPASAETPATPPDQAPPPATDASTAPPTNQAPPEAAAGDTPAAGTASEATPAAAQPAPSVPTDAEQAFNDIYGQGDQDYADPFLPAAAEMPGTFDPWEKYNRKVHRFNNAVDRHIARPLARGYVKVTPRPVRLGVSNFFNNLSQPLNMVNALLQGQPKQAAEALGRFLLNSTFGLAGILDPASRAQLPQKSEDFGQTLGVWGWKRSRYFELPLFGPRTVRDVFGMAGDAPLSPLRRVGPNEVRIPLQGLQLVDMRAQLLSTDSLREGAEDDYTLVRDAWSQRRDYQIFGDRQQDDDSRKLPDYLREDEDDSTVPVDAMPVVVPGNG
ncbi:phospholipid-binding lipoprotein MlaA [Lysobacter niabensis]|uniref:Phospholipid-binding lipoprotein MlaA n=1 Tax=Agrilutibacter niabensis TaxID=380628 RepID=A0ABU1VSW2_9GAMM|nr:MlaA family lipoprotein [Lysobacter niabensis]MDR7100198.1 phospholipid-binding lipoprotein MlaA [Lysobacter niabensis]